MRWLGWMAIVAVWFTVLVPTVSRTLPVVALSDLGAWCEGTPAAHHDRGGDHRDADADGACGYCTLFAQMPALGGRFFIATVVPVAARLDPVVPRPHHVASPSRVHAPPRGPPVATYA
jgi:hypothetical protein